MKSVPPLVPLAALALAVLAGPAAAGPDWAAIERGRAAKQEQQAAAADSCGERTLILQDHGPRPQYGSQDSPQQQRAGATTASAK